MPCTCGLARMGLNSEAQIDDDDDDDSVSCEVSLATHVLTLENLPSQQHLLRCDVIMRSHFVEKGCRVWISRYGVSSC